MQHVTITFFVSLCNFYKFDSAWWTAVLAVALMAIRIAASRARREGADLDEAPSIPRVQGILPGNIDILWQLVSSDAHECCGETLRMWAEVYGPTYDMNILWGHQVQQKFLWNVYPLHHVLILGSHGCAGVVLSIHLIKENTTWQQLTPQMSNIF